MTRRVDLKIPDDFYTRIVIGAKSRNLRVPAFIKLVVTEWLIREGF